MALTLRGILSSLRRLHGETSSPHRQRADAGFSRLDVSTPPKEFRPSPTVATKRSGAVLGQGLGLTFVCRD